MQLHAACRDMMRRTAQIQRIETFQPCSVMRSARQPVEKAEGCSIVVSCDVTSRTRQQSFKAPVQAFCRGMSLIGGLYMWVEYASPGVERYSRIGLTWSWKSALRLWDAIWDGVMVVCIKTYCRGAIHRLDGVSEPVGAIRDEGSTLIGRQRGGICPELSWQPGSFPSWKWKENIHSTVWLEWELSTGCRKKVFRLCYVFITLYKSLYVFTLLGSLAAQGLRALRVEFL